MAGLDVVSLLQLGGNGHSPLTMSDEQILKEIYSTHVYSDTKFDVNSLFTLVDNILKRSTRVVDNVVQGSHGSLELIEKKTLPASFASPLCTLKQVASEMSCKPPGEEIAHKTTLTILNKLSNYSWVAKAVLTVAAFALEYGEFWLLPQHLPTELAIIKRVPELTNPEALIKHRNAILEFNNLVKATWQVIDIIFEFEKLKSVHDTKDVPALAPAVEQIPIDVYWAIITIAAIVTQIDCLTTDSEKRQDLSQFGQKISIILSKLRKQISLCKQQIEEAECYKILKILFQTPTEIMEVFKMLIFGKDTPHAPIYEGATKTLVNIEVLKNKDVFLFISTLDISEEEISTFKPIYDHITKLGSRYKIVWLPIVEEWNDRLRSKFETLISKMPWYVLHHFAPIKGIKYIKEEWQFKKDPLVVVLNPQGKILHHNAFHMIRVWGLRGFPFTISIEESLNRTPMESVPVMNGIDPNLYLPTTIKEEKYMITFGGKDREWIQQFSKYAYEITSKRRKYDHLLDQTAGFYACRCAAEPIHVQLNLATYFIEVVNTTSEELSNIAVEVSVWELEGTCPYYKAHENLSFLPKKVTPIVEMKYPKSKNPKPVYFLLLKLYNKSDYRILSRNFYWLHLPGGDYKLLEPYRKKKIPLKITSEVFIEGSTYKLQMHVHNTSKRPDSKSLTFEHDSTARPRDSFVFQLVQ